MSEILQSIINIEEIDKIYVLTLNEHFTWKIVDNKIIIKKKIKTLYTIDEIKLINFRNSRVEKVSINNTIINNNNYNSIIKYLFEDIIKDGAQIIRNSILNIKTVYRDDSGFYYLESIGISYQGIDSNKAIIEICNQCKVNNIILNLTIKLNNDELVMIYL
jgi:hypothetical protein